MLGVSLLTVVLLLREGEQAQGWVVHTLEVRRDLRDLGQALIGAESGQRGYLLTDDERYLGLHRDEVARIQPLIETLLTRTADNPAQQVRLGRVTVLANEKLAELTRTLTLAGRGERAAALAVVATNAGLQLTDEIVALLRAMDSDELRLLDQRAAEAYQSRQIASALLLLAMAVLGLLLWYSLREQRRVLAAAREVNAELERRVAMRTENLERALRQNRILMEEVHHRAGNGLALVAAFLSLHADGANDEAADALEEARRRVVALGSAQRRLRTDWTTGATDLTEYLPALLGDLRAAGADGIELLWDGPAEPAPCASGDAVSIGVIIGELLTNALKHGFGLRRRVGLHAGGTGAPSREPASPPRVTLRLAVTPALLVIEVEDNGRGAPSDAGIGLGTRVMQGLAEAMAATLWRGPVAAAGGAAGGTLCRLSIPRLGLSDAGEDAGAIAGTIAATNAGAPPHAAA